MKVIRRRGTTPGSIIKSYPAWAKVSHKVEKGIKAIWNSLRAVLNMRNSKVRLQDRPGITKDPVFVPIEYPLLLWWQVVLA